MNPGLISEHRSVVKDEDSKKSHMIVGYWFKGVLSHEVTPGYQHDSPVYPLLIEKLPTGDYISISGDTAYCSRDKLYHQPG